MYQLFQQDMLVAESDRPIEYSKDMQAWQVGNAEFFSDPDRAMYLVDTENKPPTLQEQIVIATQKRLDDFAKTRNYDSMLSLCTYAASTVQQFAAEGQYGVQARDATWEALYVMLTEIESGMRPMPSGFADIEADLPPLIWPS